MANMETICFLLTHVIFDISVCVKEIDRTRLQAIDCEYIC